MRWIKYGTQSDIRFTMVKRAVVDLAVSADWTPAAADSAISKDGGNLADTTNTVAAISSGTATRSGVDWKLTISATEAQAAEINIQIVDAATKAVEDQFLTVYTYGNASAKFAGDWSDIVRLGLTAFPNVATGSAGALLVDGTGTAAISNSAGKVLLQAVQAGVTIPTVTAVTNGVTLAASAVQAIWDALTSALTTVGSIGKLLVDNIDAAISTRLATSGYTAPLSAAGTRTAVGLASANLDTQLAAVQADTDDIQTRLPAALVGGRMDSSTGAMAANVVTAAAIADGAIDAATFAAGAIDATAIAADAIGSSELAASAITEIQTGLSTLDAAGVRAAVGLASANLDTQLAAIASYIDTEVAAILAAVQTLTVAERNAIADAVLARNVAGGSSTGRTVKQALAFLRNKWDLSAGTLTVYDTDDTTVLWTASITATAGADPVTGSDPA